MTTQTVSTTGAPTLKVTPVTVEDFPRAESHMYFAKTVRDGAFGRLQHDRAPVAIDKQLNNLTARPNEDGSFTIQFGGCTAKTANCLVTPPGWSYVVRQYRPRRPILDGTWQFPEAKPVN